jgi:hypothetical protein
VNAFGRTSDPAAPSLALFAAVAASGFVAIAVGWHVAATTRFVPSQIAALVSGGFAGVVLVLVGSVLVSVQASRRSAALERRQTDDVLDELGALVDAFRTLYKNNAADAQGTS